MHTSNDNLILSIGSLIGSGLSFAVAFVTNYHIMGLVGFVGMLVSIYASVQTIREKRMSIRHMKKHNNF